MVGHQVVHLAPTMFVKGIRLVMPEELRELFASFDELGGVGIHFYDFSFFR